MAKPGSKQEEVLQFLDSLDAFPTAPPASSSPAPGNTSNAATGSNSAAGRPATPGSAPAGEAAEALAFLEGITQRSNDHPPPQRIIMTPRSGTPILRKGSEIVAGANGSVGRKSADVVRKNMEASSAASAAAAAAANRDSSTTEAQQQGAGGGWGWGSVWSIGSAALQQARTAVDEQVKKNDQARKWGEGVLEYVKQADKIGQEIKHAGLSTLMDIVNAVAPPISEHEVIHVWLSHDMRGYEGVENLVYRALARIMEQVEGGDLVVNKGDESRPKEAADGVVPSSERDFNAIEGLEAAMKLGKANLDELIKSHAAKPAPSSPKDSLIHNPTTHSTIFLRIQPFTSSPFPATSSDAAAEDTENLQQMQFILHLVDDSHSLTQTTLTQCVPVRWVEMWDDPGCEWMEDLVVEVLRVGVEVVGQQYLVKRMGWDKGKGKGKKEAASTEETPKA